MKGLFITGTDTGVGKTIVSFGIALCLKEMGIDVGILKPIETGCYPIPEDAVFYKERLKLKSSLEEIAPLQFSLPLAPTLAAEKDEMSISITPIINQFSKLIKESEIVLVEGAGGLMVPIQGNFYMAHLAVLLGIPIVLVIGNKLGAINHTLLSVNYCNQLELPIQAVILNNIRPEKGLAEQLNAKEIQRLIGHIPLYETQYINNLSNDLLIYKQFKDITQQLIS